jgi:phage I-like protein
MTADDVDAELEDAAGNKLADADTVEELEAKKEELDRRLSELESQGKQAKTLTDQNDADFEPEYDNTPGTPSNW